MPCHFVAYNANKFGWYLAGFDPGELNQFWSELRQTLLLTGSSDAAAQRLRAQASIKWIQALAGQLQCQSAAVSAFNFLVRPQSQQLQETFHIKPILKLRKSSHAFLQISGEAVSRQVYGQKSLPPTSKGLQKPTAISFQKV